MACILRKRCRRSRRRCGPSSPLHSGSPRGTSRTSSGGILSSLRDRTKGLTGNVASEALERAGLTCNKDGVPGDSEPQQVTSGLRFGVSAGTTRGFREAEFASIGQWIGDVLDGLEAGPEDNGAAEDAARANVTELCGRFPICT